MSEHIGWHRHRWSKWSVPALNRWKTIKSQLRTCEVCGKTEERIP